MMRCGWLTLKHGERVDELPAYAALKEVYRFILEALEGDDWLERGYSAVGGEMPELFDCALP